MRRTLKMTRLALLCAGLMACSPFGWRVAHDSGAQAEQLYGAGRAQHLAQQPDAARASYQAALHLEPGHPGARNGLATLHAEGGDLERASAIWRELTASIGLDAGPGKAYLFANLGQAYLLGGAHEEARGALERACLLDPLNPRAWQLLGDALAALGQTGKGRNRCADRRRRCASMTCAPILPPPAARPRWRRSARPWPRQSRRPTPTGPSPISTSAWMA